MTNRLKEIKDRLAAVTPGNWSWSADDDDCNSPYLRSDTREEGEDWVLYATYESEIDGKPADKELIANAPSDIAYLLTLVYELQDSLRGKK